MTAKIQIASSELDLTGPNPTMVVTLDPVDCLPTEIASDERECFYKRRMISESAHRSARRPSAVVELSLPKTKSSGAETAGCNR